MSDAPRPPVAVRIVRPYESVEEFLHHELETVGKTSVLLIGAHSRPNGVILRFEVALASGQTILRGEGRVLSHKDAAVGGQPALSLRFTRLDRKSKALVDHAATMREARARGDDPASIPPPPVVPDSEPNMASARMIAAPPSEDEPATRSSAPPPSGGRASAPPSRGRSSAPPPSGGRRSAPPQGASEPPSRRVTAPPTPEEGSLGAAVAELAGDGPPATLAPQSPEPFLADAPDIRQAESPKTVAAPAPSPEGEAATRTTTDAPLAPSAEADADGDASPTRTVAAPPPTSGPVTELPPASSGRRFGAHEAPTAEYDGSRRKSDAPPTATRGATLPTPENRDALLAQLRERAAGLSAERVAEILAPRA